MRFEVESTSYSGAITPRRSPTDAPWRRRLTGRGRHNHTQTNKQTNTHNTHIHIHMHIHMRASYTRTRAQYNIHKQPQMQTQHKRALCARAHKRTAAATVATLKRPDSHIPHLYTSESHKHIKPGHFLTLKSEGSNVDKKVSIFRPSLLYIISWFFLSNVFLWNRGR
jgi:hypothetical protein